MKKIFIVLGVVIVLIIGLLIATGSLKFETSFSPKEAPIPTGWVKYKSGEFGYSILHPDGWNLQENSGETSRELLILAPKDLAFVRVAAFKDNSLNSSAALAASIAEYKASFANKPQEMLKDFQSKVEGDVGRFAAAGFMNVGDANYQFLEKGIMSSSGRVLIIRGGANTAAENLETVASDVRKIIESFEIQ